jgi:predicted nucleic-acid-binding Zn-ribbon protein
MFCAQSWYFYLIDFEYSLTHLVVLLFGIYLNTYAGIHCTQCIYNYSYVSQTSSHDRELAMTLQLAINV